MNRVEENSNTLKGMEKANGNYNFNDGLLTCQSLIITLLADISKSLAIIADSMTEEVKHDL